RKGAARRRETDNHGGSQYPIDHFQCSPAGCDGKDLDRCSRPQQGRVGPRTTAVSPWSRPEQHRTTEVGPGHATARAATTSRTPLPGGRPDGTTASSEVGGSIEARIVLSETRVRHHRRRPRVTEYNPVHSRQ